MSVISVFKVCLTPTGFAIMSLLFTFETLSFTELLKTLEMTRGNFGRFMAELRDLGVISTDPITKMYRLKPRGRAMLSVIESEFVEKFISDNLENICINSKTEDHIFTKLRNRIVCRRCGSEHKTRETRLN